MSGSSKASLKAAREALDREDYDDAIAHCRTCLKHDKRNYTAYLLAGLATQKQGDSVKAEQAYQRACKLKPEHPVAWKALCDVYENTEQWERLLDALDRLGECTGAGTPPQSKLVERRVRAMERLGRLSAAAMMLFETLDENENNVDVLERIADLLSRAEQTQVTASVEQTVRADERAQTCTPSEFDELVREYTAKEWRVVFRGERGATLTLRDIFARLGAHDVSYTWRLCERLRHELDVSKEDDTIVYDALWADYVASLSRVVDAHAVAPNARLYERLVLFFADLSNDDLTILGADSLSRHVRSAASRLSFVEPDSALSLALGTCRTIDATLKSLKHAIDSLGDSRELRELHALNDQVLAPLRSFLAINSNNVGDGGGGKSWLYGWWRLAEYELVVAEKPATATRACAAALRALRERRQQFPSILAQMRVTLTLTMVRALRASNRLDEARKLCDKLLLRSDESRPFDPIDCEPLLAAARLALELHDWDECERRCAVASRIANEHPLETIARASVVLRARALLERDKPREALAVLDAVAWSTLTSTTIAAASVSTTDTNRDALEYDYWRAVCLERTDGGARAALLRSAKRLPRHVATFALLGDSYASESPQRAERCYRRALQLDPTDERAGSGLCRLLEPASAARVCEDAVEAGGGAGTHWAWSRLARYRLHVEGDAHASVLAYQQALRARAKDASSWHGLGESYSRLGKYSAALKAFERTRQLLGDDPEPRVLAIAECRYHEASVYRALGMKHDAVRVLRSIDQPTFVAVSKDLCDTYLQLSRDAAQLGSFTLAIEHVTSANELLVRSLADESLSDEARAVFWKLRGDVHVHRATQLPRHYCPLSEALDELRGAAQAYAKARSLWTTVTNDELRANLSHDAAVALLHYARLAGAQSKASAAVRAKARQFARDAIELRPGSADMWLVLAQTLDEWTKAHAAVVRATHLQPRSSRVWFALGVLYLERYEQCGGVTPRVAPTHGRAILEAPTVADELNESARRCFTQAQALSPESDWPWIGEALRAELSGELVEASRAYKHAQLLGSTSALAALGGVHTSLRMEDDDGLADRRDDVGLLNDDMVCVSDPCTDGAVAAVSRMVQRLAGECGDSATLVRAKNLLSLALERRGMVREALRHAQSARDDASANVEDIDQELRDAIETNYARLVGGQQERDDGAPLDPRERVRRHWRRGELDDAQIVAQAHSPLMAAAVALERRDVQLSAAFAYAAANEDAIAAAILRAEALVVAGDLRAARRALVVATHSFPHVESLRERLAALAIHESARLRASGRALDVCGWRDEWPRRGGAASVRHVRSCDAQARHLCVDALGRLVAGDVPLERVHRQVQTAIMVRPTLWLAWYVSACVCVARALAAADENSRATALGAIERARTGAPPLVGGLVLDLLCAEIDTHADMDELVERARAAGRAYEAAALRIRARRSHRLDDFEAAVRLAPRWTELWHELALEYELERESPRAAEKILRECVRDGDVRPLMWLAASTVRAPKPSKSLGKAASELARKAASGASSRRRAIDPLLLRSLIHQRVGDDVKADQWRSKALVLQSPSEGAALASATASD